MSLQHARRRAEQLINDLHITQPAVRVEEIAASLGLTVLYQDLPSDISGILISRGGVGCVVVQQADPKKRQRFTIAHEIGHYCLKHQFEPGAHVHVDRDFAISFRTRLGEVDRREAEANQFAAALLMPTRLIMEAITALSVKSLSEHHIEDMAKLFDVSVAALTLRLTLIGML